MDKLAGDDRLEPLQKVIDTRAFDVEVSLGAALDPQHATLGIAIPGELVEARDDGLQLMQELFRFNDNEAATSALRTPVTPAREN